MKIVFNDEIKTTKYYDIVFDKNIVTIKTTDNPILSGFTTYGLYDVPLTDAKDYTTLYRRFDDKYQLSNDGSEYIPPTPVPPIPPTPSRLDVLEQTVENMQLAMAENYEEQTKVNDNVQLVMAESYEEQETINNNVELALAEIYELIGE